MFLLDITGHFSNPVMIDLVVKKIGEVLVLMLLLQLTHIILEWGTVQSLRAWSALQRTLGRAVK